MPRWCLKCRRGFATVIANALGIGPASVYRVIAERLPDVKVGACRFKGIESRANGLAFMLPVRTSHWPGASGWGGSMSERQHEGQPISAAFDPFKPAGANLHIGQTLCAITR